MAPGAMGRHLVYLAQCCGYDILKTLKRLDFTRRSHGARTGVRVLWGSLPSFLLTQMPNSQGGSSAASLFSSFSTDAESTGEAPVTLGSPFGALLRR